MRQSGRLRGDGSRKSGEAIVQIAEDGSGVRAAFGGTLACCHFVEDRTEVRGILQTALPKLFPFGWVQEKTWVRFESIKRQTPYKTVVQGARLSKKNHQHNILALVSGTRGQ